MRRIVSLKKPMNDREFATGQSAKECGKIICLHVLPKKKNIRPPRFPRGPPPSPCCLLLDLIGKEGG